MKRGSMAVSSIKKKEKEQDKVRQKIAALHQNIGLVIKGKPEAISLAIITLLARGHLLIEDAPGVGKTLLAQSLAMTIDSSFQRIQFTSDLLPSGLGGRPDLPPAPALHGHRHPKPPGVSGHLSPA